MNHRRPSGHDTLLVPVYFQNQCVNFVDFWTFDKACLKARSSSLMFELALPFDINQMGGGDGSITGNYLVMELCHKENWLTRDTTGWNVPCLELHINLGYQGDNEFTFVSSIKPETLKRICEHYCRAPYPQSRVRMSP